MAFIKTNGDKEFMEFKDVSFLQMYTPDETTTGEPQYYAIFDVDNFIVAPTPNSAYASELHYYYRPQSLTELSDSGITWLSENAEMTLLYGALVESYIYMKGEQDVMTMYNKRFQESLLGLKQLGEAKETTDEYRRGKVLREKT